MTNQFCNIGLGWVTFTKIELIGWYSQNIVRYAYDINLNIGALGKGI